MNLSFSGCGFLGIYHIGAAAAVKEYAPALINNKMSGVSAGSIAAAAVICDFGLGQATSDWLKIGIQTRSKSLGALSPSMCLAQMLDDTFRENMPVDAYKRATDRLFISLTRLSDGKNVLVSHYDSNDDLVDFAGHLDLDFVGGSSAGALAAVSMICNCELGQVTTDVLKALICSSFIPFYCGTVPPTFKGVRYIDGGFSDNQPVLDHLTVTVSPFSGESDICPSDADSASFLGMDWVGTSIRFTSNNLYRLSVALFPPHPEVMTRMCRQGFEDALRFLAKQDLISCARCIEVRSYITLPADAPQHTTGEDASDDACSSLADEDLAERGQLLAPLTSTRSSFKRVQTSAAPLATQQTTTTMPSDGGRAAPLRRSATSAGRLHRHSEMQSDCETCRVTVKKAVDKGLPQSVRNPLENAQAFDKTLMGRIWHLRPVRFLRYMAIPWLLPWDLTYAACVNFTYQLAITELNYTPEEHLYRARASTNVSSVVDSLPIGAALASVSSGASSTIGVGGSAWDETEVAYGFSVDLNTRSRPVRHLTAIVNQTTPQASDVPAAEFAAAAEDLDFAGLTASAAGGHDGALQHEELDAFAHVFEYTRRHEALMAFYYMDENNQVKVTEIFGVDDALRHPVVGGGGSAALSRRHSFVLHRTPPNSDEDAGAAASTSLVVPADYANATGGATLASVPLGGEAANDPVGSLVEQQASCSSLTDYPSKGPEDSGVSFGEDSYGKRGDAGGDLRQVPSRRDACCSPVRELSLVERLQQVEQQSAAMAGAAGAAGGRASPKPARLRHHHQPQAAAQTHWKRLSAPPVGGGVATSVPAAAQSANGGGSGGGRKKFAVFSSDSEGEHGEKFFVPAGRRERVDSADYEAGDSSTEDN